MRTGDPKIYQNIQEISILLFILLDFTFDFQGISEPKFHKKFHRKQFQEF